MATVAAALLQIIDFVVNNDVVQILERVGFRSGGAPPLTKDGTLLVRLQKRYLELQATPSLASATEDLETLGAQFAEWLHGLPAETRSAISGFLEEARQPAKN